MQIKINYAEDACKWFSTSTAENPSGLWLVLGETQLVPELHAEQHQEPRRETRGGHKCQGCKEEANRTVEHKEMTCIKVPFLVPGLPQIK